jgi:hypothetical protein
VEGVHLLHSNVQGEESQSYEEALHGSNPADVIPCLPRYFTFETYCQNGTEFIVVTVQGSKIFRSKPKAEQHQILNNILPPEIMDCIVEDITGK